MMGRYIQNITLPYLLRTSAVVLCAGAVAACVSEDEDRSELSVSSERLGSCVSGRHECTNWGASCSGSTLNTCVLDENGCGKLLKQACKGGCSAGACNTCTTLVAPKRASSLQQPNAFYEGLVRKGNVGIVTWSERNGIYTGNNRGFATVDLRDPNAMTTLSTTTAVAPEPSARSPRLEGQRLYGLSGMNSVQVWDASVPAALAPLGAYTAADNVISLAVNGVTAYVGTAVGFDVVSFSRPAAPQLLSVASTAMRVDSIAYAAKRVATAGGYHAQVFDVTNSSAPQLIASAQTSNIIAAYNGNAIAFDGTRMFVGGYTGQTYAIYAFEVDGSPTLALRGTLEGFGILTSVSFLGGDLLVTDSDGVSTVDISAMNAMRFKKHVFVAPQTRQAVGSGTNVWATSTEGVSAVDLKRAPDMAFDVKRNSDWLYESDTQGAIAYLARQKSGLTIEDVRDPRKPVILSNTPMRATGLARNGSLLYVGVQGEGLRIYDVRSPWKPELISTVAVRNFEDRVSYSNGRVYATCDNGLLCVFDVSNASAPTLLGTTRQMSSSSDVFAMRGSFMYLPQQDRLRVIDVANPAAPVAVGSTVIGGYLTGYARANIAFKDNYAYVTYDCHNGAGDVCMDVVDISQPAQMRVVATNGRRFTINADAYRSNQSAPVLSHLRIAGNMLFASNRNGGVHVTNIADPLHPVMLEELWTQRPGRQMFVSGRFLTTYSEALYNQGVGPVQAAADQVTELCQ